MNQSLPSNYETQLSKAADFIREHDDFLVVSHVNPDGDAVSSTLAVSHLLRQLGKTYEMANEGRTPQKFYRLTGAETIVNVSASPFARSFKHIISVDCADFGRIGAVDRYFDIDYKLLNIDHHPTNDRFGAVPLVKDDAAATVEIISDLAHQLQADWSMPLCECIYTGLLTDTGGFRYSNTSPKVMAIASDMLARGVKGHELAERFLEVMTISQMTLLQRALATLSFAHENQIAWVYVTEDELKALSASSEDLDGIVNYPRNIEGVEVGLLFKQTGPTTFKASLRSAGKVDVSRVAQAFGGGGHIRASGCTLHGKLEDVIESLVTEVGKAL